MSDLKIDTNVHGLPRNAETLAEAAEEIGFDGIWSHETSHDAFMALPAIADHTSHLEFGTRIATAFTRSPMILAQEAWDLQAFSGGRFILGLGTQVKAHNERRFSVDFAWESPGPRLREVVESLRHIWDVFQGRTDELDYKGNFYQFELMSDTWNPGPIDHPDIPLYIAAVNEYNIRLAGELCDGICLHAFNTPSYTHEVIAPLLQEGADRTDRSADEVTVFANPFVITGRDDEEREERREEVRQRVAFYASTPTYKDVMTHHGWEDVGRELHGLSREGEWNEMTNLVTDEMLEVFAIEAPIDEVANAVRDEYGDVADRVLLSLDFDGEPYWETIVDGFRE
jgi:probable F420-dependent oxidoreductase